jgi:hypothetical protein
MYSVWRQLCLRLQHFFLWVAVSKEASIYVTTKVSCSIDAEDDVIEAIADQMAET